MNTQVRTSSLPLSVKACHWLILLALPALMAGCATPVFRDLESTLPIAPIDVQQSLQPYAGAEVLWGGRVVALHSVEGETRVEIIAYPLNRAQQPMPDADSIGRFILVIPGFAEPLDYSAGRHLTTRGVLVGVWTGQVDGRDYPFPVLQASAVNVWPWGFMFDSRPQISIGVGVGIGSQYD
ncbi:Slp family lipoprotein [Dokdonella sp.]|uniref:Slp family lipoprotein n=1 Tax=Dokdonella sp. TaxID=2291710 RepID=UPI003C62A5A8